MIIRNTVAFILKVLLSFFVIILIACNGTDKNAAYNEYVISVIPYPKSVTLKKGRLFLNKLSEIKGNDEFLPYAEVFAENLARFTGKNLPVNKTGSPKHCFVFKLNSELDETEHQIKIDDSVLIEAGSLCGLVNGGYSFLQLIKEVKGKLSVPKLELNDKPDSSYRGLLIDLARNWHDVPSVLKLIELAAFYKLNFVQLHFTDYQSYTLPSNYLPKLSTKNRHYSFEELERIEEYARLRGIAIVPELEAPGHAQAMVEAYPELFGIKDISQNPYIVNIGKEEVYEALEGLIAELIDVFDHTPYFHIGGDEAIFHMLDKDPDVQTYMAKHNLGTDIHELYRHFIVRMNEIVKAQGKQLCVWEGFRREGKIDIPKDIIVFEFETNRYLPNHLLEDGYTVVNTSWKPLYVVNEKKWSPEYIYGWNMWRWENWFDKAPSFTPIQCQQSPHVIGGQMCAWEQRQELEFPSLRKRVAAFSERVWTPKSSRAISDFIERLVQTDNTLSTLVNDTRQDTLPAFKN